MVDPGPYPISYNDEPIFFIGSLLGNILRIEHALYLVSKPLVEFTCTR